MMNNTKSQSLRKLVLASLFAALTYVMTMVIQIPSPMQGYVNLGDCGVLLSAWILGPVYGGAAAGIGSMLADLLSGYAHYAPGTFAIKLAMAVAASLIFQALQRHSSHNLLLSQAVSGVAAETIMVVGYFGYASLWLGKGLAAAASIPFSPPVLGTVTLLTFLMMLPLTSSSTPSGWTPSSSRALAAARAMAMGSVQPMAGRSSSWRICRYS